MQSANQTDRLEALGFKMKSTNRNLSRAGSVIIPENEMPGMRKEIPKEETYNKYGDSARKIEIGAIGKRGTFIRIPFQKFRGRSAERRAIFVQNENKQIADCRKITGACVDEHRKLDARFRAGGSQEFANKNTSTPTIQLQTLRS